MIPLLLFITLFGSILHTIHSGCVPTPSIGTYVSYSSNATHMTMSSIVKEIGPYSWMAIGLNKQVGGMGMGNVNNPSTFYIGHFTAAQQFQLREGKATGLYLPDAEANTFAQATLEIKDGWHNFTIVRKLEAPTTGFQGYFAVPQNGQFDVLIAFSNQQTASDAINKHYRAERMSVNLGDNTEDCAAIQNPTGTTSPKPTPQKTTPVQPKTSNQPVPQPQKTNTPVLPVNSAGILSTGIAVCSVVFATFFL